MRWSTRRRHSNDEDGQHGGSNPLVSPALNLISHVSRSARLPQIQPNPSSYCRRPIASGSDAAGSGSADGGIPLEGDKVYSPPSDALLRAPSPKILRLTPAAWRRSSPRTNGKRRRDLPLRDWYPSELHQIVCSRFAVGNALLRRFTNKELGLRLHVPKANSPNQELINDKQSGVAKLLELQCSVSLAASRPRITGANSHRYLKLSIPQA